MNPIGRWFTWLPDTTVAVLGAIAGLGSLAILLALVLGIAAIATRFRRATGVERAQLKWLLATAIPAAVLVPLSLSDVGSSLPFIDLISVVTLPLMALAIALAILRYRLYDIDRIVSRTVSWTLVTGLLVAVFAGGVLALQTLLTDVTQGETLAVAASTLVAFALFQPVRRRVQRAVDRRFDRARYDGQMTVDAFAREIRDEVDLPRLREALAPRPTTPSARRRPPCGCATRRRDGTDRAPQPVTISGRPPPSMRVDMTELTRPIRRLLGRGDRPEPTPDVASTSEIPTDVPAMPTSASIAVDIPESDPLLAYLQSAPGPVDIARLDLDSPPFANSEKPASPWWSRSCRRAS